MMTDIFITTFSREDYAKRCIDYLTDRTKSEYKLTVIDNGGNEWAEKDSRVHRYIPLYKSVGNAGIHYAWLTALSLAEGDYFVTADPDLLVPDLEPDWLAQMTKLIKDRPDYGAISMHPHVFVGADNIDPSTPEDVVERNMCGAVFRIMDTQKTKTAGGWEFKIEAGRNHEESTICSRLQSKGFKVGVASRIRAYHMFGENWGYPESIPPHAHGHRVPGKEIWPPPENFDKEELYDSKTWLPK